MIDYIIYSVLLTLAWMLGVWAHDTFLNKDDDTWKPL